MKKENVMDMARLPYQTAIHMKGNTTKEKDMGRLTLINFRQNGY